MKRTINIPDETALEGAAREFLEALGNRRHVSLRGEMGAGKTTFVSALGRVTGVEDEVTSPTFSIVNEYVTAAGDTIYHFDFYRIESPEQALELGLDDYFDSGSLCLMEWAENIGDYLPEDTLEVEIVVLPDGSRQLTMDTFVD